MNVLPPGWEVPDALPAGVTVAPAADPAAAARVIAERVGGEVVLDVAHAERALAKEAARRRARQVVDDAAEAERLAALLRGSSAERDRALLADPAPDRVRPGPAAQTTSEVVARLAGLIGDVTADAAEVRAAAARLRAAEVTAEAAAQVVGERPATVHAEIELVRARSLAAAASDDADAAGRDARGPGSTANGVLAMSLGAGLVLAASGVSVEVAACVPGGIGAVTAAGWRRRRGSARQLRDEADAMAADAERARAVQAEADEARREWEARADAAAAAADELDEAGAAWVELAGDTDVARADRLSDALDLVAAVVEDLGLPAGTPASTVVFELRRHEAVAADLDRSIASDVEAARVRESARARLQELLHGRRLDRLRDEAEAAQAVLATPPPTTLVLCDPFAALGPGRCRALLRDLERAASTVALAVVTSDEEALAWASASRP